MKPIHSRAKIFEPAPSWVSILFAALALALLVGCTRIATPQGWSAGSVGDDAIYIGTMEGDVLALDKSNGDTLWRRALPAPEDSDRAIYGRPAVTKDAVLVGGYDGRLYAYGKGGDLLWQEPFPGRIVGGPTVHEGLVLVGTGDVSSSSGAAGTLRAIDLETNDEVWKHDARGPIWSSPVVDDGVAYVGSLDHSLYAVDVSDGSEKWRYVSGGAIVSGAVVHGGLVIFGGFDSRLYALDVDTGDPVWVFNGSSRWYWSTPLVQDGVVYAPSLDGNLYAIDARSGDLKWVFATEGQIIGSPTFVNDLIAVPVADGNDSKVALVETNGSEQQACRIGSDIRTSLAVSDDLIYFGATDHTIRALRIKPNGNPDEEWVYVTDADDPYPPDWAKAC